MRWSKGNLGLAGAGLLLILIAAGAGLCQAPQKEEKEAVKEAVTAKETPNAAAKGAEKSSGIEMQMKELTSRGRNRSAIRVGEEYLKTNPDDVSVRNLLAESYITEGDLSEAEGIVKQTLKVKPSDTWALRLSARINRMTPADSKDPAMKANRLKAGMADAERGLAANPEDVWLMAEKAQIFADQGEQAKANQTIDRAISLASGDDRTCLVSIKENMNKPKAEPKKEAAPKEDAKN